MGRVLAVAVALLAGVGEAGAAATAWARAPEAAVRLLSASDTAGSSDRLRFALEFRLEPGWKTYWRNPDDGLPPRLDWTGSENLAEPRLHWPAPRRFTILGIDSVGYEDRLLLPLDLAVARPGEPVHARLQVEYATCAELCILQQATLALDLPAGPAGLSAEAREIDRWRGRAPAARAETGRAELRGTGEAARLHVALAPGEAAEDIFIEAEGAVFGRPERLADGFSLAVLRAKGGEEALIGREVVATVTGAIPFEQRLRIAPPAGASAAGSPGHGLAAILALALLGGLILNLMPCVLPVLGVKLMHFAGLGGLDRGRARSEFLAVAAGVLASFWLLAGAAVAVKQAGLAVGWGIQFQQPAFLAVMALLLALFAANLWGWFALPTPGWAGGLRGGPFLTGMFATLLATPCSAPFVGTAVGFALARGAAEIALIFTALGLGLALPYLAVAAFPGLAGALPRPGRWMARLRALLGLALAATALWLLTVLAAQTGWPAALAVGGLLALLLAWLGLARRHAGAAAGLAAAGCLAAALALPQALERPAPGEASWRGFDEAGIAPLVAAGETVFVDVTADWCLTCKVNKAAVLDRAPVADRLAAETVAMRADWTRPDAAISAYLARFGRYGIPFNAVYGPGAPAGLPLPELLTERAVMEALDRAGRKGG